MTISIRIEPETGMAIATCSGALGLSDARDGASALWNAPGWLGQSAVWDFREATFSLSTSEIREVAAFITSRQPTKPPARIAFVTTRDVDFGLSRMFEVHRADPRTEFQVFRDYEKALNWARSVEPEDA